MEEEEESGRELRDGVGKRDGKRGSERNNI